MTSGWVLRKVKQNDKWVRRWLEVNRHVLYSYQACPAESAQARVINMLDLRKTREIKLVDNGIAGLFCIVPVSADNAHPGYLMRADTATSAEEWVAGLNKVRQQELEKELLGDAQAMAPSKDDAAFELALSYAEKYEHASSSIHQRWVVFFEHALVREVLRSVQGEAAPGDLKRGEAQRKISSLFHVRAPRA
ncbi:hypothetical protein SO694_00106039 [Aureococcus anophagefferens]|uniref:PH domain-containing protein n=1 Tax=Aureococcus anophagefferens TaxID=44056 RepID=A0ABR1FML8_AURAN